MRKIFGVLGLVVGASAGAEPPTNTWQGPEKPLYVVTQNHYAEGITPEGATARFTDMIMIEIHGGKAKLSKPADVYQIGGHVNLFSRGQPRGEVLIDDVAPLQCDSSTAIVSTASDNGFKKGEMALATNSANIRSHANWSSPADATANANMRSLAIQELGKLGVTGAKPSAVKVEQLVVTRIAAGGPQFLIGSVSYTANDVEHGMFLIGRMGASEAELEFARDSDMKDLTDNTDIDEVQFVDQLDIDGDGVDEVVVEEHGYEDEAFEIYRRRGETWEQVWTGGQGGC